jgi:glycosyltransferase involved in cell wall biosynthesis
MSAPKLLFLATEDWFVRSHFAALLERARAEGFEPIVAARLSGADLGGVRAIDMPFARGSLQLGTLAREIASVRALVRALKPDLVHAIALKPIALTLFAGVDAPSVLAVTGRGYLGARQGLLTEAPRALLRRRIRSAVARGNATLLVENNADRAWVEAGRALPDARVFVMPGAGVDPAAFTPAPEPEGPIVIGIASRLIWSKGVDIAVAALAQLRGQGLDLVLRIAGAPDPDNPQRVSEDELARWAAQDGVELVGRVADMNAFWERAHIACLPSRGGEGLPRTLLEAAACGRPIVTTDVPGCADFVSAEIGRIVAAGDAFALAQALRTLASDAGLRRAMGRAGREKVVSNYSLAHAGACAARAWRSARGA